MIVKSVHEHASFGIDDDSVLSYRDDGQVQQALVERLQKTGRVHMAEQFVSGREFNLSLLELDGSPLVLAPAEIDFCGLPADRPQIVGANAKWNEDSVEYQQTPRRFDFATSDAGLIAELSGLALECWNLFELAGYARVDFRVDERGRPLRSGSERKSLFIPRCWLCCRGEKVTVRLRPSHRIHCFGTPLT